MELAAKIDDLGKPAWIGLLIVSFFIFWPLGLALLAYLIWSGRMGCHGGRGERHWNETRERIRDAWWHGVRRKAPSSGSSAFDEYRDEMLRRLEEEQRDFKAFLHRLRMARDKAEFDQFMSERSGPGTDGTAQA